MHTDAQWLARFVAYGNPEPKGSVAAFVDKRTGQARIKFGSTTKRKDGSRSDGPQRYAAWCANVTSAAAAWRLTNGRPTFDGPLVVYLKFFLPRPKSVPLAIIFPAVKPDVDKLCRGVLDCLTKAELIADDARIVDAWPRKRYVEADRSPRVEISIRKATAADL
jgi:Holliday junction resolvase RusA-like endonuclease